MHSINRVDERLFADMPAFDSNGCVVTWEELKTATVGHVWPLQHARLVWISRQAAIVLFLHYHTEQTPDIVVFDFDTEEPTS